LKKQFLNIRNQAE
jgi:hypothetical protein